MERLILVPSWFRGGQPSVVMVLHSHLLVQTLLFLGNQLGQRYHESCFRL